MGENHFAATPMALYGVVLLMAAIAYWLLQHTIISSQGRDSLLKAAVGNDWKGKLSPLLYAITIAASFLSPWISSGIYRIGALRMFLSARKHNRVTGGF